MTDVSSNEQCFSVDDVILKCGPLKGIGQLSDDDIGWKIPFKFSQCGVSIRLFVSQIGRFEVRLLLVKIK